MLTLAQDSGSACSWVNVALVNSTVVTLELSDQLLVLAQVATAVSCLSWASFAVQFGRWQSPLTVVSHVWPLPVDKHPAQFIHTCPKHEPVPVTRSWINAHVVCARLRYLVLRHDVRICKPRELASDRIADVAIATNLNLLTCPSRQGFLHAVKVRVGIPLTEKPHQLAVTASSSSGVRHMPSGHSCYRLR